MVSPTQVRFYSRLHERVSRTSAYNGRTRTRAPSHARIHPSPFVFALTLVRTGSHVHPRILPASSSYNTRALRPEAALGNLTLMLNTVWPKRSLNWNCPHNGDAWPGSSDSKCIGAAMQPNTFQGENGGDGHADPTSETPLAMAGAIQDMLMFSDDATDSFRVFYGVPDSVDEVAFHQLRAAGAFLISSKRLKGVTTFVHVFSEAGTAHCSFYLPPDWSAPRVAESGGPGHAAGAGPTVAKGTLPGQWLIKGLGKGGYATLVESGAAAPPADAMVIKPAAGEPQFFNYWGQHPGGAGFD